ncbi:MaoC family dehydratase [Nocardioides bruguierae]|uniref:MaoC family dehydratase n=1 Tax=Nocardioides bruguierae TaxID=2945102 RepID=UPI002021C44F|nr:MaoC/PaaZ C-terminal domain-containing protein [Nocardioides bruguierae]MCL8024378.1 hypothetical protein [Nocardioides bruguierae]
MAPHAVATLAKAALPSVPGVSLLPGVRKEPSSGHLLLVRRRTGVVVDADHAARYAAVCGFPRKDAVPLPYPHLLGFDLQLALMSEPGFPAPALGLVHVDNVIRSHTAVLPGQVVDIEVRVGEPRPHPRGRIFDFETVVSHEGGDVVWEETSSYLHRGSGDEAAPRGLDLAEVPPSGAVWRLDAGLGRRYAAVAGDWNPIHVHPLTAKAFGFPRAIAHGMWTMARCVATFENRLPAATTVEASFRKPVLLPGSVAFGSRPRGDGGLDFSLSRPAAPGADPTWHLLGRAFPTPD